MSNYHRPAATLEDTLIMLTNSATPITTRLSGGLAISYDPGKSIAASRNSVRPSATEIKTFCAIAQKVGLKIYPHQATPDQDGDHHIVRWTLQTTQL
jgi:lipoate-protein ligase A